MDFAAFDVVACLIFFHAVFYTPVGVRIEITDHKLRLKQLSFVDICHAELALHMMHCARKVLSLRAELR